MIELRYALVALIERRAARNVKGDRQMSDIDANQEPIVISSVAARGGLDAESRTSSETLVPMLAIGLVLVVVGLIAVCVIV
jgi:hypothetical protein